MRIHTNTVLGIFAIAFAVVLCFLWLPFDAETGFVELKRRKYTIGDSMAPGFAGLVFFISGALLLLGKTREDAPTLDAGHLRFIAMALAAILIGLAVMRWAGPLVAGIVGEDYRSLRDTVPWKYIGFALGGFGMTTALAAMVAGRLTLGAVLTGVFAVVVIIALYDLPFEDLLLPPNGDV